MKNSVSEKEFNNECWYWFVHISEMWKFKVEMIFDGKWIHQFSIDHNFLHLLKKECDMRIESSWKK